LAQSITSRATSIESKTAPGQFPDLASDIASIVCCTRSMGLLERLTGLVEVEFKEAFATSSVLVVVGKVSFTFSPTTAREPGLDVAEL